MAKPNNNLPAELIDSGEVAEGTQPAEETATAATTGANPDKKAQDKAAADKKKQDAAAAKAAKSDSDAALRAIEDNTAESVNTDPMVNIYIAKRTKEDTRAEVCINGHWWRPLKGEMVSVPRSVALILRESEKVLNENEMLKGDFEAFNLTAL
jgi:hypothetical protein